MQPKIVWGTNARDRQPVISDFATLVNGHIQITGGSGAGKTHQLRAAINQIIGTSNGQPPRIHVFDIHGDIEIPGASTVRFSEQSEYGLNPLRVGADPHYGGPRKAISTLIKTLDKVTRQLGDKQRACLRNILQDVYAQHGIYQNDPSTWVIDESASRLYGGDTHRLYLDVPINEKDDAKPFGARWDGDAKCWWIGVDDYKGGITRWKPKTTGRTCPSLEDALIFARRKYLESYLGADKKAITQLELVNRAAMNLRRKTLASLRTSNTEFRDEEAEAELDKLRQRAIDQYKDAVLSVRTGDELEDIGKYDAPDVLRGVIDRLETLLLIGIFKPKRPAFDPDAPVWRYDLKALDLEERKLFVLFHMRDLFLKAVERGESPSLTEVAVLDEAHAFVDEDDDNILNTMAREVRKFGMSLICASQSPTHFPEDFNAAMATKVILRIDETYWKTAANKMLCPVEFLKAIIPHQTALVQRKEKGSKNSSEWARVYLNQQTEARRMTEEFA